MASPPVLSDSAIRLYEPQLTGLVRRIIELPEDNGRAARKAAGTVSVPTLFLCGEKDPYLLCSATRYKEPFDEP